MVELLLKKDISNLGKHGDIVQVKAGYARNYLIPKGLAVAVNKENLRILEIEKKQFKAQEAKRKEAYVKMAEELENVACTIEARANEEQRLFGSVSYTVIAQAFEEEGYKIDEKDIELEDSSLYPIKQLGIYPLRIHLHPDVTATSKVWVVQKAEDEEDDDE